MPLSSSEMAMMAGAFQQQSMGNMQYASMIGQGGFGAMSQGRQAEGIMGGIANRGYSMGAPLLQGAMGMMGADPFSLGMSAMGKVWGAGGGVMSSGLAGIGTIGAAAGGLAAAGYAGSQMYGGMQQQQQLNNQLRSSFNFMTPQGQGFSRSDMGQIGSSLRGMTHQAGPGGEVVGFGELSQLAANMGKMGMGQGVRDAQEFSKKFKEMIGTLKSVATELGTTLEGAQQFLSSQRSSGIFRTSDQLKFSMQARGTALSGGLALSEVTAMANIGSQISRSVGGLGRSGAFGGMKAIGQVGSAMQTGALSEEDIYNTTGMTGAEGRQALAASQLEQTARFLKGSKGRWFLASVAGKNGQLDESSVANWMSGGMDVGETKQQAHANLAGIGRANFIRNEGRLRGSVMEKFGGLAPAMALSQWASGKGIDVNNMDDRSMLFAQRQLGMGRDEIDSAIKMAGAMPEILRQQRISGSDDEYQQRVAQTRRGQGIEGMKRKLEQVREGIQGKFQQVGQDLFNSGADMIEQWWNKLTGTYEKRLSADVDEIWHSSKMGGRGGQQLSQLLGTGGTVGKSLGGGGMFGSGKGANDPSRAIFEGSREKMFAAKMGAAAASTSETSEFAQKSREWIRDSYTSKLAGMEGERRISEFGNVLKQKADAGDKQAQAMYKTWSASSGRERAGMLGAIEKQTGIADKASLGSTWELPGFGITQGSFSTLREGDLEIGKAVIGERAARTGSIEGGQGGVMGFAAGTAGAVLDMFIKKKGGGDFDFASKLGGLGSGGEALAVATGGYFRSKEGGALIRGLMGGDKQAKEAAEGRLMELQASARKAGGMDHLGTEDKAAFLALSQTSLGAEYGKLADEGAPTAKVRALEQKASEMLGREVTENELKRFLGQGKSVIGMQALDNIEHLSERASDEMNKRSEALQMGGIASMEKVRMGGGGKASEALVMTKKSRADLMKGSGTSGVQAAELAITSANLARDLATADPARKAEILEQMQNLEGQRFEKIADMTTAQKKSFARQMGGTELGAEAGESLMREQRMKSLIRSQGGGGRGQAGAIASQLGLSFGKEELAGMAGKSAEELSKLFAGKLGDKSEGFQKALQESIEATKSGKIGKGADLLARAMNQADEDTKKKIQKGRGGEDPQAETLGAIKAGNKFLEALVRSNTQANAMLATIAEESKGNTEDKK